MVDFKDDVWLVVMLYGFFVKLLRQQCLNFQFETVPALIALFLQKHLDNRIDSIEHSPGKNYQVLAGQKIALVVVVGLGSVNKLAAVAKKLHILDSVRGNIYQETLVRVVKNVDVEPRLVLTLSEIYAVGSGKFGFSLCTSVY